MRLGTYIGLYAVLVIYGAVVWGIANESRHLSEWRQWGLLCLWALVACPVFGALGKGHVAET